MSPQTQQIRPSFEVKIKYILKAIEIAQKEEGQKVKKWGKAQFKKSVFPCTPQNTTRKE